MASSAQRFEEALGNYLVARDRLYGLPISAESIEEEVATAAYNYTEARLFDTEASDIADLRAKFEVLWPNTASIPPARELLSLFADLRRLTSDAPSRVFRADRWLAWFECKGGGYVVRNDEVFLLRPASVDLDDAMFELEATGGRNAVPARGVADDAIFAQTGHGSGSIAAEFSRCGVHFLPARKADRLTGWNIMRRLLEDAGKPDVPGLYISRACEYFWSTVPYLARDQKRVEDVDSSGPDHAADAVRYGCLRRDDGLRKLQISGI